MCGKKNEFLLLSSVILQGISFFTSIKTVRGFNSLQLVRWGNQVMLEESSANMMSYNA